MKYIITVLLLLFSAASLALDTEKSFDPNQTATYHSTCTPAADRTDGTPVEAGDYQSFVYMHSTDATLYTQYSEELDCFADIDLTALPDGVHYFKAKAIDVYDLESTLSVDRLVLTLRRIPTAAPNPPAALQ